MVNQSQRVAIVGTAPSWKRTPWNDPGLHIASLNDAYSLGIPRADEWYDTHPIEQFWYRKRDQRAIREGDVPPGAYIRPEGHLDWLKAFAKTNPVWLKDAPPADWPVNAQRFPWEAMQAKYGSYWASGPSWMVMHLYERGFRHFEIYGIHLATQKEYIEQRGNFEFLLGRLLGLDVTEAKHHGLWYYHGKECTVVMPEESPLLRHKWKYGLEPRPQPTPNPYADELRATQKEKAALIKALVHWPKGQDKRKALDRLQWLDIVELDCQTQLAKASSSAVLKAQLVAA